MRNDFYVWFKKQNQIFFVFFFFFNFKEQKRLSTVFMLTLIKYKGSPQHKCKHVLKIHFWRHAYNL